jgi:hypothetical protein
VGTPASPAAATPTRGLDLKPNDGGGGGLPPDSVYQTGGWASLSLRPGEPGFDADKTDGRGDDDGEGDGGEWKPRRRLEPVLLPHPTDRVDVLPLSPSGLNGAAHGMTPVCAWCCPTRPAVPPVRAHLCKSYEVR